MATQGPSDHFVYEEKFELSPRQMNTVRKGPIDIWQMIAYLGGLFYFVSSLLS